MKSEKVQFSNHNGDILEGKLESLGTKDPSSYAIFAHCFTCTKNIRAAGSISKALAQKNIATLRFDFTGLGQSEGDFADSTFSTDTKDIVSAANFLEEDYEAPQLLVGHSLGGAAVIHAANKIPSVKAVASVAAPFDPEHVTHLLQCSLEEIEEKGEAEVLLAGRPFTVKKSFLDDFKDHNPKKIVSELGRALLVLHSPVDTTVSIDNAAAIYSAAKHPKSFVTLDPADHLLTKDEDSQYVGEIIAAWAERYT